MGMTSRGRRSARASRERGDGPSSCLQVQTLIGEVAGSLWQDRAGAAGSRAVPRCLCAPNRWLPLGLASDP